MVVLAAGVASGRRLEVHEMPMLVEVLEGMQQRALPYGKERDGQQEAHEPGEHDQAQSTHRPFAVSSSASRRYPRGTLTASKRDGTSARHTTLLQWLHSK